MSKISHARHFSKRQLSSGCTSGAFYLSPEQNAAIDTSQQIDIRWKPDLGCFKNSQGGDVQGIDIYLYAPYAANSVVHAWGGVSYTSGSFQTALVGSWWNSTTAPIKLQLVFVESGTPAFLSPVPPGPIFSATFNATDFGVKNPTGGGSTTTGTSSDASGGGIFQIIGNAYKNAGLPKGSIAAAVLVPLLAVAIAIAVYVRFQRGREAERRRRWSQAVDKRMSTISTEWKGLPPSAQSEAIRQSIAIMRDSRASVARMSQLYGEGRPSSTFAVEGGGQAGVGVGARKGTGVGLRNPAMGPAELSARKSAVSFAADTRFSRPSGEVPRVPTDKARPSADTQRGRASRAFHTAIASDDPHEGLMSPTQVGGPSMLGERDIRALGGDDNVMPALNMMHHQEEHADDFLVLAHEPGSPVTPPAAAHLTPTSATPFTDAAYPPPAATTHSAYPPPINTNISNNNHNNPFAGFTRGPSTMLSPDAMLRAYASGSAPGTPMLASPPPVAHQHIFPDPSAHDQYAHQQHHYPALDAPAQPAPVGRTLYEPGRDRKTFVSEGSRYSVAEDEDAYGGYGTAA